MPLIDHIESATEEELLEANKTMRKLAAKKLFISIAVGVIAHFAVEIIVGAIEKKTKPELTE